MEAGRQAMIVLNLQLFAMAGPDRCAAFSDSPTPMAPAVYGRYFGWGEPAITANLTPPPAAIYPTLLCLYVSHVCSCKGGELWYVIAMCIRPSLIFITQQCVGILHFAMRTQLIFHCIPPVQVTWVFFLTCDIL